MGLFFTKENEWDGSWKGLLCSSEVDSAQDSEKAEVQDVRWWWLAWPRSVLDDGLKSLITPVTLAKRKYS